MTKVLPFRKKDPPPRPRTALDEALADPRVRLTPRQPTAAGVSATISLDPQAVVAEIERRLAELDRPKG